MYKIAFASQGMVVYKGSDHVLCTSECTVEVVLLKENMSDIVGSRRGCGSFWETVVCRGH